MPLVVTCTCGKQLQVPEEHAGKRIKCPGCQALLTAPARAAAPRPVPTPAAPRPALAPAPAAPAADLLRFSCPKCGKVMQARAENAGRATRCPGCQTTFTIQSGGTGPGKASVSTAPPAPKPPRPEEVSPPRQASWQEGAGAPEAHAGGEIPYPKMLQLAGMIWIVFGCLLLFIHGITLLLTFAGGVPITSGLIGVFIGVLFGVAFLYAGLQSAGGTAKDTLGNSIGSLVIGLVNAVYGGLAVLAGMVIGGAAGFFAMLLGGISVLCGTGLLAAGGLALAARNQYKAWQQAEKIRVTGGWPDEAAAAYRFKMRPLRALVRDPMLKYVGISAGALLLLVAFVMGGMFLFSGGPPGGPFSPDKPGALSDMALVPGEGEALFSLRVGDLWKNDLAQRGLKMAPPDGMAELTKAEQDLSLSLGDVERITVALKDSGKDSPLQQSWWVVVRTSKPYDQKKILDKIQKADPTTKVTDKTHQDTAYKGLTAVGNPVDGGIYFVHDQLLVIGTELGVKAAIELGKAPKKDGSLSQARSLIEGGKQQLVLGGTIPELLIKEARGRVMQDPLLQQFEFLLDAKTGLLSLALGPKLDLDLKVGFGDPMKATRAKQALDGLLALGRIAIGQMKGNPMQKAMAEQAEQALNGVNLDVAATDLKIKVSIDLAGIAALLPPTAGPGR